MTAPVADLTARLDRTDRAVARVAAAPVRHVPDAFLAALLCVEVEQLRGQEPARVLQLAR